MNRLQCNTQFGFIRVKPLAIIALALVIAVWLAVRWQPERVVKRQQAAFAEALEDRSGRKLQKVLAEDYRDQWGFSRHDAVVALLDVGSQFFVLGLEPIDPAYEISDGEATVTTKFEMTGTGSPIAQEVIRRNNQLKQPFIFTWVKQGIWPGNWRLNQIENPDLPDELFGYEPGDIAKAMEAGGGF